MSEISLHTTIKRLERIPVIGFLWRAIATNKYRYLVLLLALCGLFLAFGLHHLGQFMSVDEEKWLYRRVPKLYDAWAKGDWKRTLINDKPGVLPAFLAGFVNQFKHYSDFTALTFENYLYWWRCPIVVFNCLMLFFVYRFSSQLLDRNHGILITGLTALHPVIIGLSQIVNPDATLWSTSFVTLLTYFLYLKTTEKKYILFTGIFFTLALISKFNATIFYFAFFIILYLEYLSNRIDRQAFLKRSVGMFLIFGISILGYFILIPATWLDLSLLLKGTINAKVIRSVNKLFLLGMILLYLEATVLKGLFSLAIRKYLNVRNILLISLNIAFISMTIFLLINLFSGEAFLNFTNVRYYSIRWQTQLMPSLIASSYTTLFVLPIMFLIGCAYFLLRATLLHGNYLKQLGDKIYWVSYIFFIIAIFIVGTSIAGHIAQTRYQAMLFPLYAFIASVGLLSLRINNGVLIIVTLGVSLLELCNISPFYYHYTNLLNYNNVVITDAWGYGGFELAKEANKLPNAEKMVVWTDRQGFKEFFVGKTYVRKAISYLDEQLDAVAISYNGYVANELIEMKLKEGLFNEKTLKETGIKSKFEFLDTLHKSPPLLTTYVGNNKKSFLKLIKVEKQPEFKTHIVDYERFQSKESFFGAKVDLSKPYALSFWLTLPSDVKNPGAPFLIGNDEEAAVFVQSRMTQNKRAGNLFFKHLFSNPNINLETGKINDNLPHHFVWYQYGGTKGSQYGLYVDGVLKESHKTEKHMNDEMNVILSKSFKGKLDDMRLYDTLMLNPIDVKRLYEQGSYFVPQKKEDDKIKKAYQFISLPEK